MNKTIEKKLLHFFTSGSIYEDFSEARSRKISKLRQAIRVCFYAHCAAAVLNVVLAAVLHAGLGIIAVVVGEIVLAGMAFLSVGDMTLMKTLLYCGDIVFAAAMFVTGALNANKTPFFTVGAVSIVTALIALGAFFAAMCRTYLENFSPLSLRREHYTLLPNLGSEPLNHDDPDPDEEPPIVLPPKRTEIQELADKLKDILCAPKEEEKSPEISAAENVQEPAAPDILLQTEVTQ